MMWEEDGAKTIIQRIREKLREIEQSHQVPPLADNVLAALERIKRNATEEEAKREG
jgi:hypothetical protein